MNAVAVVPTRNMLIRATAFHPTNTGTTTHFDQSKESKAYISQICPKGKFMGEGRPHVERERERVSRVVAGAGELNLSAS